MELGGNCCFVTSIFGMFILISCLFIIGIPKFVIGIEYWHDCPRSPVIPRFMVLAGIVNVLCVGHSLFLWTYVFRKHLQKRRSHDMCLVLWALLMLTVPLLQLIGNPFIIYIHANHQTCDVTTNVTSSPTTSNQSTTLMRIEELVTIANFNNSDSSYSFNSRSKVHSSKNESFQDCLHCNDVLLTCAYVTALFELIFMTIPLFCVVIGVFVFRLRKKMTSK